jgi:glycosyltransferase involved in cell wall biosynthesis
MRCLFLVATFPSQGTCLRAESIARVFAGRGHAVDLLAVSPLKLYRPDAPRMIPGGIRRFEMPRWMPLDVLDPMEGWNPLDLFQRFRHVLREPYDLVYAFESKPACFWPARLTKLFGATLLLDRCDLWGGEGGLLRGYVEKHPKFLEMPRWKRLARVAEFRLQERAERRAPRRSAGATVISKLIQEETLALGVPPERLHLLYTPSSAKTLAPMDKAEARRQHGFPPDAPLLGMVATYTFEEPQLWARWREMLDAMPDLRLLLIGTGFVAPPDWAREGPLAERVRMPGFIPFEEIGSWMAACDILWCPLEENRFNRGRFPQKFFDYIAAGRPVFASDVGDVGSLIREHGLGGTGRDLDELARVTLDGLRASPEQQADWGANSRHAAETEFSPETAGRRLEPLMKRVLPEGVEF